MLESGHRRHCKGVPFATHRRMARPGGLQNVRFRLLNRPNGVVEGHDTVYSDPTSDAP